MIKKLLAIILAFFIVFSPVYSYAVLPALAASVASAGGRVLVGNVIHNLKKAALSKAGMAWMATGVAATAGLKSAIQSDDWTIGHATGGGGSGGSWNGSPDSYVDDNGDISISIYKSPEVNQCQDKFITYSNVSIPKGVHDLGFLNSYTLFDSLSAAIQSVAPAGTTSTLDNKPDSRQNLITSLTTLLSGVGLPPAPSQNEIRITAYSSDIAYVYFEPSKRSAQLYGYVVQRSSPCESDKRYMTDYEFNSYLTDYVTNNQSGDIIKNIYNYDYSQHSNITTNNNTTGGTDINNDLSISADPELNVTPRLRLDLENNRVNLDNVNDTNCTKTEQGEYDNCTGEEEEEEEETDPNEPVEPPPIECSANGFYQKICNWMDWTKQTHTSPENTQVDVTDKSSEIFIDDTRINFDDQCPTPKDIDITVAGHSFSDALDYQPLCDFFIKLRPFVVGMGGVSTALIIAGGVRRG